ncbi:MAG: hypothetical protein ACRCXZ_02970 [Patescibacteria group bacterium]
MFKLKKSKVADSEDYRIDYMFHFELKNVTESKIKELFRIVESITDGGEFAYEFSSSGNHIPIDPINRSIDHIIDENLFKNRKPISFLKKSETNSINRFSVLSIEKNGGCLYVPFISIIKDHLQEFYNFIQDLNWFKENEIYPIKMSLISCKINDYKNRFFYKKYLETQKWEYLCVANNDFNIFGSDNWSCLEPINSAKFEQMLLNKQFGSLPLFPFPDYTYLEGLPFYNITHFPNKSAWIQLVEDVCLWEEDKDYNEALLKFVDAYIEKRDKYFYSLPIEEQESRLADMKQIPTTFMSYKPLPQHMPKEIN